MSQKEVQRSEVLSRVQRGELKLSEAAPLLEVSYRQAKRLQKRYRAGGAPALVHGNVGRESNRAKPAAFREQVIEQVGEHYGGGPRERFGPTLAAEHLQQEQGLEVSVRTLRRWMLAAGLWSRGRKRKPHRSRRQRRAHFGELLQLDGSHHHWLEGRGPKACLMNLVDDATGRALCRFSNEETTWAAADLLEAWVLEHGIPQALYCDGKNVYQRRPTSREAIEGIEPQTQFGRMCGKLGISIIAASSPQAKGRVERHHGTHQDRLIKKMRLGGITDYEAANRYLEERYLDEHNARFAGRPAVGADFHRRLSKRLELKWVFCLEAERVVANDTVVRFENRFLQLKPQRNQGLGAGARVTVQQARCGKLRVLHQGHEVAFDLLPRRQPPRPAEPQLDKAPQPRLSRPPAADHPWRRYPTVEKTARRRGGLWK